MASSESTTHGPQALRLIIKTTDDRTLWLSGKASHFVPGPILIEALTQYVNGDVVKDAHAIIARYARAKGTVASCCAVCKHPDDGTRQFCLVAAGGCCKESSISDATYVTNVMLALKVCATDMCRGAGTGIVLLQIEAKYSDNNRPRVLGCAHCGHVQFVFGDTPIGICYKGCGGCRKVNYCDTTCQKAAWPVHKLVCNHSAKATAGD